MEQPDPKSKPKNKQFVLQVLSVHCGHKEREIRVMLGLWGEGHVGEASEDLKEGLARSKLGEVRTRPEKAREEETWGRSVLGVGNMVGFAGEGGKQVGGRSQRSGGLQGKTGEAHED
jgi:hypothetical protein